MIHIPDNDGRYKMNSKEYIALLRLCATLTALKETESILEDRVKLHPMHWCWFKNTEKLMDTIIQGILDTVPVKKLLMINREIRAVRVQLHIGPDAGRRENDQVIYVNEMDFIRLLDQIVGMNCLLCEKKGKEVKKCPWLKIIEDVMPYGPDPALDPADGSCQIAGRATIVDEEV